MTGKFSRLVNDKYMRLAMVVLIRNWINVKTNIVNKVYKKRVVMIKYLLFVQQVSSSS